MTDVTLAVECTWDTRSGERGLRRWSSDRRARSRAHPGDWTSDTEQRESGQQGKAQQNVSKARPSWVQRVRAGEGGFRQHAMPGSPANPRVGDVRTPPPPPAQGSIAPSMDALTEARGVKPAACGQGLTGGGLYSNPVVCSHMPWAHAVRWRQGPYRIWRRAAPGPPRCWCRAGFV